MKPRALFARLSEEPSAVVSHAGICEGDLAALFYWVVLSSVHSMSLGTNAKESGE